MRLSHPLLIYLDPLFGWPWDLLSSSGRPGRQPHIVRSVSQYCLMQGEIKTSRPPCKLKLDCATAASPVLILLPISGTGYCQYIFGHIFS